MEKKLFVGGIPYSVQQTEFKELFSQCGEVVDATIVRMVLVPATMDLLGDRNWWMPNWLQRFVPHVDVEGTSSTYADPSEVAPVRVPVGAGR